MLIALGIAEYDATIVEVEGGACTGVVLDSMPSLPVAVKRYVPNDNRPETKVDSR